MSTTPVLVLHAAGLDERMASFLDIEGVVAVTLPGHGDRHRARPGLSLQDMADEVAGWVHAPLDIIGLSMGGMIALQVALEFPERVRSLVLACTTGDTPTDLILKRAIETTSTAREEMVSSTLERWFTAEYLVRKPEPEPLTYARACLEKVDQLAFADTWRAIAGHDVLDRLGQVTVPVTCIAGSRDVSTPPKELIRLDDGLPNSRYVEVDAPHMAMLEDPEEFRGLVLDHLAWVASLG